MSRIPYKWLVAIAFVAAFFMDLMDVTIVNVAIPCPADQTAHGRPSVARPAFEQQGARFEVADWNLDHFANRLNVARNRV